MFNFSFFNKLAGIVVAVLIFISTVNANTLSGHTPILGFSGMVDGIAKLDADDYIKTLFIGTGKQESPGLYKAVVLQSRIESEKDNFVNNVLGTKDLFYGSSSIVIKNISPDDITIKEIYSACDNTAYIEEDCTDENQIKGDFLIKRGGSRIFNFEDIPCWYDDCIDSGNFVVAYTRSISNAEREKFDKSSMDYNYDYILKEEDNGALEDIDKIDEEKRKSVKKLREKKILRELTLPNPLEKLKIREKKTRNSVKRLFNGGHEKEKVGHSKERGNNDSAVNKNKAGIDKQITQKKQGTIDNTSGMIKTLSEKGKSSNGKKDDNQEKEQSQKEIKKKIQKGRNRRKLYKKIKKSPKVGMITHMEENEIPSDAKNLKNIYLTEVQRGTVTKIFGGEKLSQQVNFFFNKCSKKRHSCAS